MWDGSKVFNHSEYSTYLYVQRTQALLAEHAALHPERVNDTLHSLSDVHAIHYALAVLDG